MAAVLVTGSIAASVGYLIQADGRRQAEATHASRRYQDRQAQLETLDQQLRMLARAAASDQEAGYRSRAAATLTQVEALRQERIRVSAELEGMDGTVGLVSESGFFSAFGASLHMDAARIRFGANVLVAIVLEFLGIAAVWLLRERSDARVHPLHLDAKNAADAPPDARPPSSPIMMAAPLASSLAVPDWQVHPAHSDASPDATNAPSVVRIEQDARDADAPTDTRYQRACELVTTRAIDPSYRALQRALRLGQGTAKRFLETMITEGLILREGRRHAVVGRTRI